MVVSNLTVDCSNISSVFVILNWTIWIELYPLGPMYLCGVALSIVELLPSWHLSILHAERLVHSKLVDETDDNRAPLL